MDVNYALTLVLEKKTSRNKPLHNLLWLPCRNSCHYYQMGSICCYEQYWAKFSYDAA